jgi:hypothetical protein
MERRGEMIMSSIAQVAVAAPSLSESLTGLWAQLAAGFYRFVEKLPDHSEEVDPQVFKRVPVPV